MCADENRRNGQNYSRMTEPKDLCVEDAAYLVQWLDTILAKVTVRNEWSIRDALLNRDENTACAP